MPPVFSEGLASCVEPDEKGEEREQNHGDEKALDNAGVEEFSWEGEGVDEQVGDGYSGWPPDESVGSSKYKKLETVELTSDGAHAEEGQVVLTHET